MKIMEECNCEQSLALKRQLAKKDKWIKILVIWLRKQTNLNKGIPSETT